MAPVDPDQLLAAVRAVDPAGTEAMAVIRRPAIGGEPPVLAVDSDRLGVMVDWRDEYGGELTKITAALLAGGAGAGDPLLGAGLAAGRWC